MNANIYLETSAVNYFANRFNYSDALATKGLQRTKGNVWYLSPVTLWEIFLIRDTIDREKIIYYCQHLFDDHLLSSPSEILIHHIESGCPRSVKHRKLTSNLSIAQVWKDICFAKETTFEYDHVELQTRTKIVQQLSKQLEKIIHRIVLDINIKDTELEIQQFINQTYPMIEPDFVMFESEVKTTKIALLLGLYFLCIGTDLDATPQLNFWKSRKIYSSLERLLYLIKHHSALFFYGPLYQMSIMAYWQITHAQKSNRGLFMDCLHSIYIPFCDIFLTNDAHFKDIKAHTRLPNFENILHLSDTQINTYTRDLSHLGNSSV